MSIVLKIKKVMPGGWRIIETFIPGNGLSNEYLHEDKLAP